MFKTAAVHWKKFFLNPCAKYVFILTVVLLVVELNLFDKFLIFIQTRQGVVLNDPVLNCFSARNFSTLIFIIIYGSMSIGFIALAQQPRYLMLALQTYILMLSFRFIAMYLTPLEMPEDCIILKDPVAYTIGTGQIITKDLFFSGHIATLTLLFLTARNNYLKYIFLALTIILAILIMMQKVHYTIDILAAPFFVYACWSLAKRIDLILFKRS